MVFTSDNGYFLGEHRQRSGKIKPHEESLRVPLVVAGPGIPHGVRHAPVTTIDVTATILDLAVGVASGSRRVLEGAGLRGRRAVDRAGRHRGGPAAVRTRSAASPAALTEMGLRTGRYAYFRYSTGEGELYDLATDPLQLRSRYDDPAYRDVRRDLTSSGASTASVPPTSAGLRCPPAYQVSVAELAEITAAPRPRRTQVLRRLTRSLVEEGALAPVTKPGERRAVWPVARSRDGQLARPPQPADGSGLGVVGVLALAVEVAQEVGVVVGGDGPRGRAALRASAPRGATPRPWTVRTTR